MAAWTGLNKARDAVRRVQWYWWAVGYFILVTLALTWPLVLRMRDSIVGGQGDNLYFVWLIGWFQKSLFTLHRSPLVSDLINHPEGWNIATTEMTPAMVVAGLPFSLLRGPTFGYNASVLASFALSGIVMCIWVYRLTGKLSAGLIAGTVFAFSSYRFSHYLAGHLNLLGTHWLALYFLALYEALDSSPRRGVWVAVGGVSLGLISLTSQYYLYMTLVLTALLVLLHALLRGPRFVLRKSYGTSLLMILAVSAPLLALGEYPYLAISASGGLPGRNITMATKYSASLTDYLLPSNRNPVAGDWVDYHFDRSLWIETSLYLGVATSVLALFALLFHSRNAEERATQFHLLAMAAVSFVLSLGPSLRWFSREVSILLPPPLAWLNTPGGDSIRLPSYFLYQHLPYYMSIRVPARYGVYVLMFLSVLAGIGAAWLISRPWTRGRAIVVGALLAVMIIENLPPRQGLTTVEGRAVDYWLAEQPGGGAVVQLPLKGGSRQALTYYTLVHGRPFVSGYDEFTTSGRMKLLSGLSDIPDKASIDRLRSIGVRYVIVDAAWYDEIDALDDLEEAFSNLGVDRPMVFEGYRAYTLDP